MEGSREYRDYRIEFSCRRDITRIATFVCEYSVYIDEEFQFRFPFCGTKQWLVKFPDREGLSKLIDDGFDLACGLIDTERYEKFKKGEMPELDAEEYEIPEKSEISNEKIRHEILKALSKIPGKNSKIFETEKFNDIGFCKVLRITKDDFDLNSNYLKEIGLIEKDKDYMYITHKGIDWLDEENYKYRIIDPITTEMQKFVHERLKEINPDIFNSLERIKQQLIEEGKNFKWQQVAFRCRDIIQDFTHSLYRPEYLPEGEKAPKKSETKKKLRFILQNRLNNSEKTERELLEGLIEYLYKYFDCLNELIQKGVHEDIEKSDAERCLLYTYLFIGDVLRLTKL